MPARKAQSRADYDPDVMMAHYLNHIKLLPVYGQAIADLMECNMKLTEHIFNLHRRLDELEAQSDFHPTAPEAPSDLN
jgi:hypothetical protein